MNSQANQEQASPEADEQQPRAKRVDAQRNLQSLLQAAMDVFTESGVDAPVRAIAEKAGVGVGTVYRHFPQRADLIVAVMKSQIDACADAAAAIAAEHEPGEALARWMQRYVDFILTKRGLSGALQSDSAAYAALPEYFYGRLRPALTSLLEAAVDKGVIRPGFEAGELLRAVATLCKANPDEDTAATRKMVGLLVDGLRCRT
jgi:AcrR family transcriptional regulator